MWEGLRSVRDGGLTRMIGLAPGPANGFTLDVIGCFERYGELIDWTMLILNPFEPWPGELALDAAGRHGVKVLTRVVDYAAGSSTTTWYPDMHFPTTITAAFAQRGG